MVSGTAGMLASGQTGAECVQRGCKGRLRGAGVVVMCVVKTVAESVQRGRETGGILNVVVHDCILIV